MIAKLSSQCHVTWKARRITFYDTHRHVKISLSPFQMDNLHDALHIMHHPMYYIPLGGRLFIIRRDFIALHDQYGVIHFTSSSWNKYRERIHPRIMTYLKQTNTHKHECDK